MATLNYNWQLLNQEYVGSTGSLNVYIRAYAKLNSQDTQNNRSYVSYESRLYLEGSGSYFYSGSTTLKSLNATGASNVVENAEGTYYKGETTLQTFNNILVNHNDDGRKSISMRAVFNSGPWGWDVGVNGSADLPKINRTTTNSVSGTDIDGTFSVNYTKYTTTNTYKLRISLPNIGMLEKIDYNTSDEPFTLSQTTIESLYARYTTVNTFRMGFAVETWSSDGNTKLSDGNEVIINAKITGANPVFTDFAFEDTNLITTTLTGNNKYNINGYSNIKLTISTANKAVAQKGASMVKYRVIVGSQTLDLDYSENEITTTINNSDSGTYQIYAIDTRGNSTLVTKLAEQVIQYTPIYLNASLSKVERNLGGIGENAILTYSGTIWNNSFGSVNNNVKVSKYEYKETSSNVWITPSSPTDITPTLSGNSFSFSDLVRSDEQDYKFDLQKNYDFKITLEDELSSATIQLTPMPSGIPNISYADDGIGIMCDYDENLGGLLQVGGKIIDPGKILWTNPDPTSSFGNVTITLSSDDYDMLEIFFYDFLSTKRVMSERIYKGQNGNLMALFMFNAGFYMGARAIEYTSDTQYLFGNARKIIDNGTVVSGVPTANSWIVPLYVVGYKTGLFN